MSATYVHHLVLHFPIALLITAAGAQLAALVHRWYGWRVVGGMTLLAGTAAAIVAAASGLGARSRAIEAGISAEVVDLHQLAGLVAAGLAIAASIGWLVGALRRRLNTPATALLVAALSLIAAAGVSVAGHLGGSMLHPGLSPIPEVHELAGVERRAAPEGDRDDFDRGLAVYEEACQSCHGAEGEGIAAVDGPPVFGEDALPVEPPVGADRERTFETGLDVLSYVRETMPLDEPGALSDDDYREVVRLMLHRRGLTVPRELSDDAARELPLTDGAEP